jgi:RNA polymerase sigma-70 factor (ECF subfamily)
MTDLELVAAVLAGDATAVAGFEGRFAPEIRQIAARLGIRRDVDELVQSLLVRIVVGGPDAAPKLASYRAQGSLHAWVRAVTTRFVIDHVRHARAQPSCEPLAESQLVRSQGIDGALQQARWATLVRDSVCSAFDELSPRERNLLRAAVFHRLSVDELGAMYHVHRATAARWLQRTREALHDAVAIKLRASTGMSEPEARSVLREIGVDGDVSLRSVLSVAFEDDGSARVEVLRAGS